MAGLGIIIPRNTGGGEPVEVWTTYASDTFTGSGTPHARNLDNGLGGSAAAAWQVTANYQAQFGLTGGALTIGTQDTLAALCVVPSPAGVYRASARVVALPTANSVSLCTHRSALSGGTDYRLTVSTTGGVTGALAGFTETVVVGDYLAICVDVVNGSDRVRIWKNGTLVKEGAGSAGLGGQPGLSGFTKAPTVGAFAFDDFKIETAA